MKKNLSYVLCMIFLCMILGLQADAKENKRMIRVGWYERDGYFEQNAQGEMSGFGVDYLNAIAGYTGWEYEYIKGTRSECMERLEAGTIDLFSPVGVNEEIVNASVAREVIGEDYGYIYKLEENQTICYEDFENFEQMVVGMIKESGLTNGLLRYCEENNFHFKQIQTYDTLSEMQEKLENGEIDAIVMDSYANLENRKVIGGFSNEWVSFAATDNNILKELNTALEVIKVNNPSFSEELRKVYFSVGSQYHLEYTVEEQEFLLEKPNYTVVLCKDQYPISYESNYGNEMQGIALDILKKIEEQTGLNFEIQYVKQYEDAVGKFVSEEADILGGGIFRKQELLGEKNEYRIKFYEINMTFVGENHIPMKDVSKVAVPAYFQKGIKSLNTLYPQYEFRFFENDKACLEAILDGTVDAAVQTELKINELLTYKKYKNMHNIEYIPGGYEAVFSINIEDKLLYGILDKALKSISDDELAAIVNNNIQHIALQSMSFQEFLSRYKVYLFFIFVLLVVANIAVLLYRRYRKEIKNKERAYRDSIADISSMAKFRIDVTEMIQNGNQKEYYAIAVDIDKFKVLNDLYGYDKGDKVIAFIGEMLKKHLGEKDFLSRTNADNFIVLKAGKNIGEVQEYLNTVFKDVGEIMQEKDLHYRLLLKAGIYPLKEGDTNISGIIDRANIAKRNIKQNHISSYQLYDENMRLKNIDAQYLENEMEKALETRQFCIYLQPQIDLKTKEIVSAEALVRWIHPKDGIIWPERFIPLFEKNGFIKRMDSFVWEEAVRTIAGWREQGKVMVPIAINLSRIDVERDGMVEELTGLLQKYNLSCNWIKTELTESVCLEKDTLVMDRMQQLKNYGFKIAVDDFGSGYSSLHLLKKMPIDILKIDKSFLDFHPNRNFKDEIVIRDVVNMGKHLNLEIIVEGVETKEQSDFLKAIGCDVVQGYFYGRPMPVAEFEKLLEKEQNKKHSR